MARKRTLNRKDFIGDFDEEAEGKKAEDEEEGDEEEADEEEAEEAEAEEEPGDDEGGGDDEEAPKPKKPKKKKAPAAPRKARAPKVVRMKAVWIVYDNGSKQIETFPYSQQAEAQAFLEQKNTDKKGACFLQLVKVPFDEK
jgi:cobalamin biosynthesis protein CobT